MIPHMGWAPHARHNASMANHADVRKTRMTALSDVNVHDQLSPSQSNAVYTR